MPPLSHYRTFISSLFCCLTTGALVTGFGLSAAQPAISVYVANEFERVRPGGAPGSTHTAVLGAARNEYAPFQIVVHAGESGLKRVNAAAGPLKAKRGETIPGSRITLYREHFIEVKKLSPKSKGELGWYPDALIPFVDPSTGKPPLQGRFSAAPFQIPSNSNQPLWVDVQVPKEAVPGDYEGAVTVSAQGEKPIKVPVHLTVWDFTLPDMHWLTFQIDRAEGKNTGLEEIMVFGTLNP
jgi:hypothetical protein